MHQHAVRVLACEPGCVPVFGPVCIQHSRNLDAKLFTQPTDSSLLFIVQRKRANRNSQELTRAAVYRVCGSSLKPNSAQLQ